MLRITTIFYTLVKIMEPENCPCDKIDEVKRITIQAHKNCYDYIVKRSKDFGEKSLPKTIQHIIRLEKTLREKQNSYDIGMNAISEKIEREMREVERKCESNAHDIRSLKLIETETNLNQENIQRLNEEIKFLQSLVEKNIQTERDLKKQILELEHELNAISPSSLKRNDLVKRMEIELAPFVERTVISTLNTLEKEMADDELFGSDDSTAVLTNEQKSEIAAAETQAEYLAENEPKGGIESPADDTGERTDENSE